MCCFLSNVQYKCKFYYQYWAVSCYCAFNCVQWSPNSTTCKGDVCFNSHQTGWCPKFCPYNTCTKKGYISFLLSLCLIVTNFIFFPSSTLSYTELRVCNYGFNKTILTPPHNTPPVPSRENGKGCICLLKFCVVPLPYLINWYSIVSTYLSILPFWLGL